MRGHLTVLCLFLPDHFTHSFSSHHPLYNSPAFVQHPYPLPHLPLVVELLHGTAHLRHNIIWPALAPDPQVPLSPPHPLVLRFLWVQLVQRVPRPGRGLHCQERLHALGVGLKACGSRGGGGQVLIVQEGVWRTGGQIEVFGLGHDAAVVDDEVVGHSQGVMVVAAVQASQDFFLSALKLLTHLLQGLVVDHVVAVGRVLWEQVLGELLFEPFILSGEGRQSMVKVWVKLVFIIP